MTEEHSTPQNWKQIAVRLRTDCLDPIKQSLIGKDEIIEVLGVALIAGENVFLLGPPGTAKSALVQELASRLKGQSFDYLLTRFTEPSELFGPFDLRRLRDGDLVTNTEGMLPEADFVFLDELMNANSAVLNSLLLALNERVFRRGRETRKLPMLLAIGASNRLPDDDALTALFDRFLLRVLCENVDQERLSEVLTAGWRREQQKLNDTQLEVADVAKLQAVVTQVDLQAVRIAYIDAVGRLRDAGLPISDRRAVRLQRAIAASAVVCGRDRATVSDLWVLKHIWESPAQIETIASHVDAIIAEHGDSSASTTDEHPLANQEQGPDPERLLASLTKLMEERDAKEVSPASIADSLALLSSKVEWVKNEHSRAALRQRVAECQQLLQGSESE
jgi:MoxR-like ATPase